MTRPLLILLAAVLTAAMLARSAAPAAAFACVPPPPDPLQAQVVAASLIYIGTVTAEFTEPPLDPSVPDTVVHPLRISVQVDRYLKGSGPQSFTYDTSIAYQFSSGGGVLTRESSCFFRPPVGSQLLVLAAADGTINGQAVALDNEYGQDQLRQITAILNAETPTKLPESGGPLTSKRSNRNAEAATTVGLPLAFLLGAEFVWRRRRAGP